MQGPGGVARNVAAATLGITVELEAFAVGPGEDECGGGGAEKAGGAGPGRAECGAAGSPPSAAAASASTVDPPSPSRASLVELRAHALAHSRSPLFLSGPVRLVSAVGDDAAGRLLLESWRALTTGFREPGDGSVRVVAGGATPSVSVIYDGGGEVAASIADVDLVEAALSPADVRDAVRAGLVGPSPGAANGPGAPPGDGAGNVGGGPRAAPGPTLMGTASPAGPSRAPYSPSTLPPEPEAVSEGEITGLLPTHLGGRALGAALAAQAAIDVELSSEETYRAAAAAGAPLVGAPSPVAPPALAAGAASGTASAATAPPALDLVPSCAPVVVLDANLTAAALLAGAAEAHRLGARVWVEPTSAPKAKRAVHCARACWVVSPNVDELLALADELDPVHALGVGAHGDRNHGGAGAGVLPHALVRAAGDRLGRALREVVAHAGALGVVLRSGIEYVVLTLGKAGVAIVCAEPRRATPRRGGAEGGATDAVAGSDRPTDSERERAGDASAGPQGAQASIASLPTPVPLPSPAWRWGDRRASSQPPRKLRSLRVALIPAPDVPRGELKSATGAGDALVAGAIAALARGSDLLGAVLLGSAAAGRALRAPGPTPAEGWDLPTMLVEADELQKHVLEVSIPLVGVASGRALL